MHLYPKTGTLLFLGSQVEKEAFSYAKSLLSENAERSATLFAENIHPDFYLIAPQEKSYWIKIDQVRHLIEWSFGRPQISKRKVAIISPADQLNVQAANALLKTLEEPSIDTIFILVSDRLQLIPLTIRSRCHVIRFTELPDQLMAKQNSTEHTELKAVIREQLMALRDKRTHPVAVSELWAKKDLKLILTTWYEVLYEGIRFFHQPMVTQSTNLWNFIDKLSNMIREAHQPNPPNAQLALDTLLIEYFKSEI